MTANIPLTMMYVSTRPPQLRACYNSPRQTTISMVAPGRQAGGKNPIHHGMGLSLSLWATSAYVSL